MSARVVHFEVPFDDAERARSFYQEVFDWQIQFDARRWTTTSCPRAR